MNIFEDVTLSWEGKDYVVSSDKVMGLIAVIEDVITIEEICAAGVKRAKVAKAFAVALRYAGCKVDEQQVYTKLFGAGNAAAIATMVNALLVMMIPPEHLQTKAAPAKPTATRPPKKTTASLKRRT